MRGEGDGGMRVRGGGEGGSGGGGREGGRERGENS